MFQTTCGRYSYVLSMPPPKAGDGNTDRQRSRGKDRPAGVHVRAPHRREWLRSGSCGRRRSSGAGRESQVFSSLRHQRCNPNRAITAGVRPLPLRASAGLPLSRSSRTIWELLAATARCSAAFPTTSTCRTRSGFSAMSERTRSMFPSRTAWRMFASSSEDHIVDKLLLRWRPPRRGTRARAGPSSSRRKCGDGIAPQPRKGRGWLLSQAETVQSLHVPAKPRGQAATTGRIRDKRNGCRDPDCSIPPDDVAAIRVRVRHYPVCRPPRVP